MIIKSLTFLCFTSFCLTGLSTPIYGQSNSSDETYAEKIARIKEERKANKEKLKSGLSYEFYKAHFDYSTAKNQKPYQELFIKFDIHWSIGDVYSYQQRTDIEYGIKKKIVDHYISLSERYNYSDNHKEFARFISAGLLDPVEIEQRMIDTWEALKSTGLISVDVTMSNNLTVLEFCHLQRPGLKACLLPEKVIYSFPLPKMMNSLEDALMIDLKSLVEKSLSIYPPVRDK